MEWCDVISMSVVHPWNVFFNLNMSSLSICNNTIDINTHLDMNLCVLYRVSSVGGVTFGQPWKFISVRKSVSDTTPASSLRNNNRKSIHIIIAKIDRTPLLPWHFCTCRQAITLALAVQYSVHYNLFHAQLKSINIYALNVNVNVYIHCSLPHCSMIMAVCQTFYYCFPISILNPI